MYIANIFAFFTRKLGRVGCQPPAMNCGPTSPPQLRPYIPAPIAALPASPRNELRLYTPPSQFIAAPYTFPRDKLRFYALRRGWW